MRREGYLFLCIAILTFFSIKLTYENIGYEKELKELKERYAAEDEKKTYVEGKIFVCKYGFRYITYGNKRGTVTIACKEKSHKYLIKREVSRCECPYDIAKDGSRCGKRSAYSRSGGNKPVCYEKDFKIKGK